MKEETIYPRGSETYPEGRIRITLVLYLFDPRRATGTMIHGFLQLEKMIGHMCGRGMGRKCCWAGFSQPISPQGYRRKSQWRMEVLLQILCLFWVRRPSKKRQTLKEC